MPEPISEMPPSNKTPESLSPVDRYRQEVIGEAEELVKQGKYKEAIQSLLINTDITKAAGVVCRRAISYFASKPVEDSELRRISNQLAYSCRSEEPTKYSNDRTLFIPGIEDKGNFAPTILWLDAALVAIEEHFHAVQSITGKTITMEQPRNLSILDEAELHEIDVVYTLIKDGVPIDEFFLQRHGRETYFLDYLEKGMKLVYCPLGVGSFVKVQRSDGRIEDGWRVIEMLPDDLVEVHDAGDNYKKIVPLSMLKRLRSQ